MTSLEKGVAFHRELHKLQRHQWFVNILSDGELLPSNGTYEKYTEFLLFKPGTQTRVNYTLKTNTDTAVGYCQFVCRTQRSCSKLKEIKPGGGKGGHGTEG